MRERLEAVDTYIATAKPFARPILVALREAVHRAVPETEEQMKWSRPFFIYHGVILGNMAAFSKHCSFGVWGSEMAGELRAAGLSSGEGMGSVGKIVSVDDLPPVAELEGFLRKAAELIGSGQRAKSIQRVAKPTRRADVVLPKALEAALQQNEGAAAQFQQLSPSCQREYAEWIAEAKREATQAKRVAQAMAWIVEGKRRHWKYEGTK